jgi:hypothetical protein
MNSGSIDFLSFIKKCVYRKAENYCLDEKGRFYVRETYFYEHVMGVFKNGWWEKYLKEKRLKGTAESRMKKIIRICTLC